MHEVVEKSLEHFSCVSLAVHADWQPFSNEDREELQHVGVRATDDHDGARLVHEGVREESRVVRDQAFEVDLMLGHRLEVGCMLLFLSRLQGT